MAPNRAREALLRLWQEQEWMPNMVIKSCAGTSFKVHADVVCEQSRILSEAFLSGRCDRQMDESDHTLERLILCMYGLQDEIEFSVPYGEELADEAFALLEAASKYELPDFGIKVENAVSDALDEAEPSDLVFFGTFAYSAGRYKFLTQDFLDGLTKLTIQNIDAIMASEFDWKELCSSSNYVWAITKEFVQRTEKITQDQT